MKYGITLRENGKKTLKGLPMILWHELFCSIDIDKAIHLGVAIYCVHVAKVRFIQLGFSIRMGLFLTNCETPLFDDISLSNLSHTIPRKCLLSKFTSGLKVVGWIA